MSALIRKAVEAKLQSEGVDWASLKEIDIDNESKSASASIELEGESLPVAVSASYALEGDEIHLLAGETSKPWMTKLLAHGLEKHGGRFPLPGGIQAKMLRMFL